MDTKFWKNKKVLITGYEGFLGSHLSRALLERGANIYGLDILVRRKYTILTERELSKINIIKGSVENFPLVSRIVKKNKIEFIFHLAAKSLVEECFKTPLQAFSANIRGTYNVLEASRGYNTVKGIIISSSDKAYGTQKKLPYKESFALAGCHPYDVSKSCADLLAYAYFYTYDLPACVTRCGNIYGPGDFNFSRIIPEAISAALEGETLFIRSNGKFTRDYIYVKDIINGYLLLAQKMQTLKLFGEAFNFSNEKPISVLELVRRIYQLADKKPKYKILNQAKYEIRNQYLSSQKAKKILGWKPRYTLEEGLKETIAWYRDRLQITDDRGQINI
jgi:CDP-glucose 4,6-dehydratase